MREEGPDLRADGSKIAQTLDELDFPFDPHIITHQDPSRFQGGVPIQSKVLAVELALDGKPGLFIAPGIGVAASVIHREGSGPFLAPDGKLPVEFIAAIFYFF